jgi:hypothetical protein
MRTFRPLALQLFCRTYFRQNYGNVKPPGRSRRDDKDVRSSTDPAWQCSWPLLALAWFRQYSGNDLETNHDALLVRV